MGNPTKLSVLGTNIVILNINDDDFISLTDIARYKNPGEPNQIIRNRLRNKNTIEFLGLWETLYNNNFKPVEFDGFRKKSGGNTFTLSPTRRIEATGSTGLVSKQGKYGGTFAHKDIALEFASRVSIEVKLYLLKDYQRLKENEMKDFNWNVKRLIAKMNYAIHTDAMRENLIPKKITSQQKSLIYADEADIINLALFGITAKQRRDKNGKLLGSIRDYTTVEQLLILSNMESLNAEFIRQEIDQQQRLELLNNAAIQQMKSLIKINFPKKLEAL